MKPESLLRRLGLKESTALVIGTIIGTGVFLKTAVMAQHAGSPLWVLVAWFAAGALSFTGALTYAELGSLFPRAGGEYVYLREAYGPLAGFLFGWMRFWIGSPGSIAAYAVGAAIFLGEFVPLGGESARAWVAVGFVAFFTGLNCLSVAFGGRLQWVMTALKIIMIVGLTFAIFTIGATGGASFSHLATPEGGGWRGWTGFGSAVLAALWAFDGWNNLPMAAGEVRDPGRVIPRALGYGMVVVLLIYASVNVAYFYALPFTQILHSQSTLFPAARPVATNAAAVALGSSAVGLLSIAFVISALAAMNGSILTGARVPYAMARDGLFIRKLGEVSSGSHVPVASLLVQGVWAAILAKSAKFDQLTDYVVFASWIFYASVTSGLFVFRRKLANVERPFRTPGYPVLPCIFLVCSVLLLLNTLLTAPRESLIGLAFIITGIPVYFYFARKKKGDLNNLSEL